MLEKKLLKEAPQFDVHKWSDFPEVNNVVSSIFDEIKALRKSRHVRVRGIDEVKKHLKVVVLDMWSAYSLSTNPYRGISKNKSDYQKGTRYRKIHLKYDYLMGVINDLVELGYIEQKLGKHFVGTGFRTRIKATQKLINTILSPKFGVEKVIKEKGVMSAFGRNPDSEEETIILKDEKGKLLEYEDTEVSNRMRENIRQFNNRLTQARIALDITDSQFAELGKRLALDNPKERPAIDYTSNRLHRVFNNGSFELGGRFYGGWWQNIPREFRKYITINRKPTVELDYSGHHLRILYAREDLPPPDDPYDLEAFDRDHQKSAILIMLNASNRNSAIRAMINKGIDSPDKLSDALSQRHQAISKYFFTGIGLELQFLDSQLAEYVMLEMMKRNAVVLPLHDSFIVGNGFEKELDEVMSGGFASFFGKNAKIKAKKTMLEEIYEEKQGQDPDSEIIEFVTDDLEEILTDEVKDRTKVIELWGY